MASSYQFCRVDAKTADHFFLGFPSYWNVVAFYVVVLDLSTAITAAILLVCTALVFIPVRYLYPSRTKAFRSTTLALTAVWLVAYAVLLVQVPDPQPLVVAVSLLYLVYYAALSIYLTVTATQRRRQPMTSLTAAGLDGPEPASATGPATDRMLLGLAAALAAAVVFGGASILQAIGSRRVSSSSGFDLGTVGRLLRQPPFVAALLLNLLGFVLHLVAVRTLPLFLAQAGIAASLAVTALLAVRIFHDQLGAMEWSAVAAVCLGLALLTAAAGETGEERATATSSRGAVRRRGRHDRRWPRCHARTGRGLSRSAEPARWNRFRHQRRLVAPAARLDRLVRDRLPRHVRAGPERRTGLPALLPGPAAQLDHRRHRPDDRASDGGAGRGGRGAARR
jgi:hypothetical protein